MTAVKIKSSTDGQNASFIGRHRRGLVLCAAFLLPMIIFVIILAVQGFYPFGTKTTVFMDLKDQYMEFLGSLRYSDDSNLLFNWSRSMGGNVLGLYAYYSGGILSYITCLFPVSMLYAGVLTIQVFEIGLCGLTFGIFLVFTPFRTGDKGKLSTIIFATAYALMSYNMVYVSCFMWLTGCIFLPLCMLGIEKILDGKNGILFYISLALAMILNYYTAYMICVFSVLYFVFRVIGVNEWSKTGVKTALKKSVFALLRYAGCGIAAAATALPVILPVYTDLMSGKLSSGGSEVSGTNFEFSSVFSKLLPGQYDSITNEGALPSIYTGLVCLLLAIMFFFAKKIRTKEKVISLGIIILLLICFWQKVPDCFWHGMQVPNWFPYRYAFVFGFFMIYLAARSYDCWIELIKKLPVRTAVTAGLVLIISIELYANAGVIIEKTGEAFPYLETAEYESFINKTEPLVREMKEQDDSFYRTAKDYEFSKNDAMLLGYNGMTHYSSTYNAGVNNLTPRLGVAQSWIWNSGYGATPLVDALFGVKYRLATKPLPSMYVKLDETDGVVLYKNSTALSLGYAADEAALDTGAPEGDVFSNQDAVISGITGEETHCFEFQEYTREDAVGTVDLRFTATADGPEYLYLIPDQITWGDIYVNDVFVNNYFSTETICTVYLGTFAAGESVDVKIVSADGTFSNAWIARLDSEVLSDKLISIGKNQLKIDDYGAGSVEGSITLGEGQALVTTIPYDEGFTVKCDGEKVDYDKWLGTFIAVRLPAGSHEISISFVPSGFVTGLIFGILGVMAVVIFAIGNKIYKKRFTK